jgi:starch phosphorylase
MPYLFNKITVRPQLPKRIEKLDDISYNLWWSWNTDFLKLFKEIDIDLWEKSEKNPIKFLRFVSQDKLEAATKNQEFLNEYDKVVRDFEDYMDAKGTWFSKNYPNNQNDLIAYFSAEYGLDETVAIYSGGLGVLSGDHLKSSSDMGIPLVGVGLLYKNGYFQQEIDGEGKQKEIYKSVDLTTLPIKSVKGKDGKDLLVRLKFPNGDVFLKVWKIDVGRTELYLMDSDIDENKKEYRDITTTLYGGDQEMRIKQEIVLGMGGVSLLYELGLNPTVYHMNEGHSAFLTIELIKDVMKYKQVSFNIAKDIVSSKTVFTTHTPVKAGNDIFPVGLVEKYFDKYWERLGISKEEFLRLGMKPNDDMKQGFNMGILALKIAGKKNGVSKLHGAVSRELFSDVWPNVPANESPIEYVTNGIHTCTWLAPTVKRLYNDHLRPYWQDNIQNDDVWQDIYNIPDEELWKVHQSRKEKMLKMVKKLTTERLRRYNYSYDDIDAIVSKLDPNVLTIGFARRFATYKRATLIFRDLERITKIFNEQGKPIQIIFAGKAHPQDQDGKNLIKYIHDLSLKPQFKGKIFILENYNVGMSRYLVSGVDVWLNNPRRPMEASGTSGQKAAANGVLNFSVLDGWWAEGYNQKNGWTIGTNAEYQSYDKQDDDDSASIYDTLENKIIPLYYDKNDKGYSENWIKMMKNSIATNAGRYSTSRMLKDYTNQMYIPLCNLTKKYYSNLENVANFDNWKETISKHFDEIKITQSKENYNNITIDAGNRIQVSCEVELPEEFIDVKNIEAQAYYGKITDNGVMNDIQVTPMEYVGKQDDGKHKFTAKILLKSGGDYGYTFRVIPKNEMLLNSMNLDLIKWITD